MIHPRYWPKLVVAAMSLTGCFTPAPSSSQSSSNSTTTTPTTVATIPDGPRAVKIIFKQDMTTGSFNSAPAGGTLSGPGFGHPAVRLFDTNDNLLTTWPSWLTRFEIGISGADNTKATDPNCARFSAALGETSEVKCNFLLANGTASGSQFPCGGEGLHYRVSEINCGSGSTNDDGVYLRAYLNRGYLGPTENLLVVVEYAASGLNGVIADPTACFNGGSLAPEKCSDIVWKSFLKHMDNETIQPFSILIPPVLNVDATTKAVDIGRTTKQITLPLASDPTLRIFQISRMNGPLDPTTGPFKNACVDNSPKCVGVVFYSITFYRI